MVLYEWKTQSQSIHPGKSEKKKKMLKTGQNSNSSHGKRWEGKERILNNGENKHKQTTKKHLRKYTQYKQKLQAVNSFQDLEPIMRERG